jgi:hypothetical protein
MPIGLTTVRQDAVLLAEYAVRFAVERLEDPELTPREAVLDPKLVVRGSSGRTRTHGDASADHQPPAAGTAGLTAVVPGAIGGSGAQPRNAARTRIPWWRRSRYTSQAVITVTVTGAPIMKAIRAISGTSL